MDKRLRVLRRVELVQQVPALLFRIVPEPPQCTDVVMADDSFLEQEVDDAGRVDVVDDRRV